MLPWVYGFEWEPAHLIFVGAFFMVGVAILSTLGTALFRSLREFWRKRAEAVVWHSEFEELPAAERACRHDFTGEMEGRVCELGFDCRQCATHAKLVEIQGGEQGLGMMNRLYHRGHTWVRLLDDGTALVGLDEIGRSLIGTPDRVEAPPAGSFVRAHGTGWRVRRNGREFRVRAPIDGEVLETNTQGLGWVLKLKPCQPLDTRHLLRGAEVHDWYARETDRLQLMASTLAGMPALADGGVLMNDLAKELPPAHWEQICSTMFLDN